MRPRTDRQTDRHARRLRLTRNVTSRPPFMAHGVDRRLLRRHFTLRDSLFSLVHRCGCAPSRVRRSVLQRRRPSADDVDGSTVHTGTPRHVLLGAHRPPGASPALAIDPWACRAPPAWSIHLLKTHRHRISLGDKHRVRVEPRQWNHAE